MTSNSIESSGKINKYNYFDALCHSLDGLAVVGTSSLTYQYWTGKIDIYKTVIDEHSNAKCEQICGTVTDCTISNVKPLTRANRIISTFDSGTVSLWELDSNKGNLSLLTSEDGHDSTVTNLAVNRSESKFATTGSDCSIKVWLSEELLPLTTYNAHMEAVSGVAFHPEGDEILLTCSEDSKTFLWDLRNSKPVTSIVDLGYVHIPTSISWMPLHSNYFVVGTRTGSLLIVDSRTMSVVKCLECCSRSLTSISFSPLRPTLMALSSQDTSVSVYSAEHSTELQMIMTDKSHKKSVQEVSWNPVNGALLSCSWDGSLKAHFNFLSDGKQNL